MKKFFFVLLLLNVVLLGKGQTITINTSEFDVSKPYGQGASITVPISLSSTSCFDTANVFNLYLCDVLGNVVNATPIGNFKGFFATYVNGIIPTATLPGSYTLKVQSTSPVVSATTATFQIGLALPNFIARVNPTISTRILSDQLYFGWCSTQQVGPSSTLVLQNQSSTAAAVTFQLKEGGTGIITSPTLSGSNLSIVLKQTYYTLTVRADSFGIVSTKSYFLINTPNNIVLSNNGQQKPCLPDSVYFQIPVTNASSGGIGENFPGMRYKVDWNDGSTTYYRQCDLVNRNGIISHFYTASSCDKGGSYYVTPKLIYPYFINNPSPPICDGDVGGVSTQAFVYSKPFARFQNVVNACVSNAVTFKNNSDPGSAKGATANSCNYSALYFWYVNDSLVYQSSGPEMVPPNLVYTFNKPGNYKIQLVLDNSSCSLSDTVRYICIEPKPVPIFTMNGFTSFVGCAPASPTMANTTVTNLFCGPPNYNWSVLDSLKKLTVPSSDYTIVNYTDKEPAITIKKPGKYFIQLCVSNACGQVCTEQSVTVGGIPIATLPTNKAYCGFGKTIDFATDANHKPTFDSQYGNTHTYQWTVSGGAFSYGNGTSSNSPYPQITFNNLGPYTVSLTYGTNCGVAATVTQQITFNAIPTFTAPASQTVCGGAATTPINFVSNPVGATFNWTNNNAAIGLAISGTGNINSFTTNKPSTQQVATITITPTLNGCAGNPNSITITVNPTPTAPTATSPVNYCQNAISTPLAAVATTGNSLNWYTVASGGTASNTAPTPSTTTVGSTNYYVSQISNTNPACEGNRTNIVVTITGSTTIDTASTKNPTVCQGNDGAIVLKGLAANTTYMLSYSKNGIATPPISITSSSTGTYAIGSLTAGSYTNIAILINNCSSNILGPISLSDPSAPATPVINSNTPICSGATINLSASSTTGGVSFTWSGPNGFSKSGPVQTIPNATIAAAGTYSVVAVLNGCTSGSATVNYVVNETPIVTATNNNPCSGTDLNFTATSSVAGVSYAWVGPGFATTNTSQNPAISNATSALNGTYTVTASTATCSASANTSVIVKPTPNITSASSTNPTSCASATATIILNGLNANIYYDVSYTKSSVVSPALIQADASGKLIIPNLSAGVYSAVSVTLNGCVSNTVGPFTITDPNAPAIPNPTSNSPICSGGTLNLNTTSSAGATFSWVGPNGFNSMLQAPSITNASVAAAGTYSVVAILNGCTSDTGRTTVAISQTPVLTVTNNNPCAGTTLILNATSSVNGVTYAWTGPTSFASTAQNPTINNASVALHSGTYNVTATIGACSGSGSTSVVVKPTPVINASTKTNPSNCGTATGSITLSGLAAITDYVVSYMKNGVTVTPVTITSNGTGDVIISSLTAGVYTNITVTLNGCISNSIASYTLSDPNPPATPVVGSNSPICSGTTLNLTSNSTTAGVTYNWVGPNTFTSTVANPSITNTTLAAAGSYTVTATLGNCVSLPATTMVIINETPAKPSVTGSSPVCQGNSINLTASTSTTGTITYTWAGPNAFKSATQNPTIANASTVNSGYYSVFATNTNGNCIGASDSVNVLVNGALTNTITNTPQSICASQSVTVTGQAPVGGNGTYTYQWQQSVDNISWIDISGATLSNITFSPASSVYVRRVVASSACTASSNSVFITVQPSIANNTVLQDSAVCIGSPAPTLVGSTPTGGNGNYTYQWQNSTDGGTTWLPIASATSKNYLPPIPATTIKYRRVVTSSLCTGPQANTSNVVTITVNPQAKAQYTYTKDISCAVFDIAATIQNVTNPANGSYLWYANNVLIGSGTMMPPYSITNAFDSVIIKLKAVSLYGCNNDSLSHKFYTTPSPTPTFAMSDSVGCGPLTVSFTNTTGYANLFTYAWDFGNGVTSTVANPGSTTYQINPTHFDSVYTVTLSASSTCQTVTTTKLIRVKAKPQALFTPNKSVGCSPLPITFSNNSRGNNLNFIWDFGDGSATFATNSTNTVQHTYSTGKQDTFKVKLIAINSCGNDTVVYSIIVSPNAIKLYFAVNGTDAVSCLPSAVHFINNTSGATSFNWDFGDGNVLTTTKNIDTVIHTYTTAGTYTTKLSATNGCSDTSAFLQIKAYAKPLTKFTASPLTACLGDTVYFTNQTDTATGYTWRYGDGNGSVLTNPTYTYKSVGSYKASLVAVIQYSGIACTDSAATTITVVAKLTGSFKVSDSVSTCVPFKVVFTNLSVPSVFTTWDYGDGIKDTGDLVQHTYITSGIFTAKMTAVNAGGCTYESSKTIVVKGPAGTWVYDKGFVCAKKSVQFQVNAVNIDSLRFNFGDGTFLTTTNAIVNHTYTQSGNYLPSVQLLAGASCYVTLQGVDTIKIDNVKAGFTISQQKVCGNATISFNDTSRAFYGIQSWQWNYGDGTAVGTTQTVQHTYTVANSYAVQLIITGKSGCTDTANLQLPVTINTKPNATIQAPAFACANQKVTYMANITSADSVILKVWKLANGTNIIGASATYIYPTAGTYTTTFVVGTINGCYDTAYNTITINPSPTVVASADVTICKGQSTQLLASGSGNFTWTPTTNLSCSNCANPSAFPSVTTNYVVSSTNGFGCTSTDTVVVTVAQPFTISVTPSDSICIGQSAKLGASGAFSYIWSPSVGLNNPNIQNPIASPVVTTNYQVTGTDQYNCFTATANVIIGVGDYPVVKIGQSQVLAAGSTYTFTPKFTNGPIAKWLWTPSANLDCTTCPTVTATAKNDVCYTATATNIYGCAASDTVCIKVFCESAQVFIPNAFMPGTGTGVNDVLMVRGQGIKLVKSFRIYNRWGQVVFERANFVPNDRLYGWDGLIQGKPANTDVYIYTCEVVCENDTPFVYKGNVAILR